MKYFIEEVWKVALIVLYGVFVMVAALMFFTILLSATPLPSGFETGFAIISLVMASLVVGICSGFSYRNISSGFWISELVALILLLVSHLITGNMVFRAENIVIIIASGLGGITGSIIERSFRTLFQKIRSSIFKTKGVKT